MTLSVNKINTNNFTSYQNRNNKVKTSTKIAAATGSVVGVTSALALISRGHGIKIPSSLKNPKEVVNILKKIELKEKDVIEIASSSIAGGIIGGSLTDSKNTKAKVKEGVVQLIGNYIVPTLFVGGGIKLNKLLNKHYNFPPVTKAIQFAFGFTSLIAGVIVGNKAARKINSKVFEEKEEYRKLNWKDWAVQFDNACLVTSISNTGTEIAKIASRVIPAAHLIPGYLVGIKRGNN